MDATPLRFILFGAGRMGGHHLAAAARGTLLRPVGIVDPAPAARATYAAEPNPDGLAAPGEADCAIVATPEATHFPIARTCLERGLHVLVEKPLCPSLRDARALAEFARERGRILAVGMTERFNPAWSAACAHLAGRRVRTVRVVRDGTVPRASSRGPAFDLAIHDLDLLSRLLPGQARVAWASSRPDRAEAELDYCGVAVAIRASWGPGPARRSWLVECDDGILDVDFAARSATWTESGAASVPIRVAAVDPLAMEHEAFHGAIARGAPGQLGPEDHLVALDLCERIEAGGA